MYYIGIDIAKFKHAIFIQNENGEIINKGEYFENTPSGFQSLLTILNNLDQSQQKKDRTWSNWSLPHELNRFSS